MGIEDRAVLIEDRCSVCSTRFAGEVGHRTESRKKLENLEMPSTTVLGI